MNFDRRLFTSKVARRIFSLFVLCALLPITFLAVLTYMQVSEQLESQSVRRLQQSSKTVALSTFERLLNLQTQMEIVLTTLRLEGEDLPDRFTSYTLTSLKKFFTGMSMLPQGEPPVHLFGSIALEPSLTPEQHGALAEGKTVLITTYRDSISRIFLVRGAEDTPYGPGMLLLAEADAPYLWGIGHMNALPPLTELTVYDESGTVLVSSLEGQQSVSLMQPRRLSRHHAGCFDWELAGSPMSGCKWDLFMKSGFHPPTWTFFLSQTKGVILAPLRSFKTIFPLATLLAVWIVLLLSISLIRRSLTPLERLKEGTMRLARRDFTTRIQTRSNDEFQDLARSFNTMATQLEGHFKLLETRGKIDRAILSSLERDAITRTFVHRLPELLPCQSVGVWIRDEDDPRTGTATINEPGSTVRSMCVSLPLSESLGLDRPGEISIHVKGPGMPSFLQDLDFCNSPVYCVVPIFVNIKHAGLIILGCATTHDLDGENRVLITHLADQFAVALENSRLVSELSALNIGTLKALARVVDARSPWTSGHSERVTALAVKIARQMGLPQQEIEDIRRAGLLHDIGKIGISSAILEKPASLTDDEMEIMRRHPENGARILEPIRAYAPIIPIVSQHHERYDGSGYPKGINGDEIALGARIMAVADVYDAIISDRPYRQGWELSSVLEHIRAGSGTMFDPRVVKIFFECSLTE